MISIQFIDILNEKRTCASWKKKSPVQRFKRLPTYLSYLKAHCRTTAVRTSPPRRWPQGLHMGEVQVRKDLALVSERRPAQDRL